MSSTTRFNDDDQQALKFLSETYTLLTSRQTKQLVSRQAHAIRKIAAASLNAGGIYLYQMKDLCKIFEIVIPRFLQGEYQFGRAICDILDVACLPFTKVHESDSFIHRLDTENFIFLLHDLLKLPSFLKDRDGIESMPSDTICRLSQIYGAVRERVCIYYYILFTRSVHFIPGNGRMDPLTPPPSPPRQRGSKLKIPPKPPHYEIDPAKVTVALIHEDVSLSPPTSVPFHPCSSWEPCKVKEAGSPPDNPPELSLEDLAVKYRLVLVIADCIKCETESGALKECLRLLSVLIIRHRRLAGDFSDSGLIPIIIRLLAGKSVHDEDIPQLCVSMLISSLTRDTETASLCLSSVDTLNSLSLVLFDSLNDSWRSEGRSIRNDVLLACSLFLQSPQVWPNLPKSALLEVLSYPYRANAIRGWNLNPNTGPETSALQTAIEAINAATSSSLNNSSIPASRAVSASHLNPRPRSTASNFRENNNLESGTDIQTSTEKFGIENHVSHNLNQHQNVKISNGSLAHPYNPRIAIRKIETIEEVRQLPSILVKNPQLTQMQQVSSHAGLKEETIPSTSKEILNSRFDFNDDDSDADQDTINTQLNPVSTVVVAEQAILRDSNGFPQILWRLDFRGTALDTAVRLGVRNHKPILNLTEPLDVQCLILIWRCAASCVADAACSAVFKSIGLLDHIMKLSMDYSISLPPIHNISHQHFDSPSKNRLRGVSYKNGFSPIQPPGNAIEANASKFNRSNGGTSRKMTTGQKGELQIVTEAARLLPVFAGCMASTFVECNGFSSARDALDNSSFPWSVFAVLSPSAPSALLSLSQQRSSSIVIGSNSTSNLQTSSITQNNGSRAVQNSASGASPVPMALPPYFLTYELAYIEPIIKAVSLAITKPEGLRGAKAAAIPTCFVGMLRALFGLPRVPNGSPDAPNVQQQHALLSVLPDLTAIAFDSPKTEVKGTFINKNSSNTVNNNSKGLLINDTLQSKVISSANGGQASINLSTVAVASTQQAQQAVIQIVSTELLGGQFQAESTSSNFPLNALLKDTTRDQHGSAYPPVFPLGEKSTLKLWSRSVCSLLNSLSKLCKDDEFTKQVCRKAGFAPVLALALRWSSTHNALIEWLRLKKGYLPLVIDENGDGQYTLDLSPSKHSKSAAGAANNGLKEINVSFAPSKRCPSLPALPPSLIWGVTIDTLDAMAAFAETNSKNINALVHENACFYIADLIASHSNMCIKGSALALLADLIADSDGRGTIQSAHAWSSPHSSSMGGVQGLVSLLLELWHSEQDRFGAVDKFGCIQDCRSPLSPDELPSDDLNDNVGVSASLVEADEDNLANQMNNNGDSSVYLNRSDGKEKDNNNEHSSLGGSRTAKILKIAESLHCPGIWNQLNRVAMGRDMRTLLHYLIVEATDGLNPSSTAWEIASLTRGDLQALEVIKSYPTIRLQVYWRQLRASLLKRGIKPLQTDALWVESEISAGLSIAESVKKSQVDLYMRRKALDEQAVRQLFILRSQATTTGKIGTFSGGRVGGGYSFSNHHIANSGQESTEKTRGKVHINR